jgi:serine/threonine-protein kinase
VYQAILERRPAPIIARLKELVAKPDPALGYINGELRFYLGWIQQVTGDHAAAEASWRQARTELEPFVKDQPENTQLLGDLAFTYAYLGDKTAAMAVADRAMAAITPEKDALYGHFPLEIVARVAAVAGDSDRAIPALQKLLSVSYASAVGGETPLTPALLRLDSMFDPIRNDPRFRKLAESGATK